MGFGLCQGMRLIRNPLSLSLPASLPKPTLLIGNKDILRKAGGTDFIALALTPSSSASFDLKYFCVTKPSKSVFFIYQPTSGV